ncbi:MAG: glycoside hydrolase family 3 protein [Termitinemataceae bacterium]|nr:MAG: glycoside hydrolase family 3 protein [Termitinemataceae bacterium]
MPDTFSIFLIRLPIMNVQKKCVYYVLCTLFSFFCFFFPSYAEALNFKDDTEAETLAGNIADALSDEDALAQILMFGWRDISGEPSKLIREWISRRHIGSVKVFGWNTADTEQLARNIGIFQRLAGLNPYNIPLLVATDQEGGLVRHVKGRTIETPGAMAIGASGFPQDAYLSGYYIGRELAILGINMNFAPTVDLYTNHRSVLIGSRSFGDNPANAGIMGIAFAKGLKASGVIPTAKHFPGHGDTDLDSHGTLPTIDADFDTLWDRELVPYRMFSAEGLPAVMSGHLAFPNTASKMIPASLSQFFLTDILRTKIGFKGVVVTDDIMMNGATYATGSLWRTAKEALIAGNDILMMNSTPELDDSIWTNLVSAMRTEPDFKRRVREAAKRVLALKLKYLRGTNAPPLIPDIQKVREGIPDKEGGDFFYSLAARSATTIKNGTKNGTAVLPLNTKTRETIFLLGQSLDFFAAGKKILAKERSVSVDSINNAGVSSYWYSAPITDDLMRRAAASDIIIFYLSNNEGIEVLRSLRNLNKKIIVLSVLSPAYIGQVSWVDAAIAVYSDSPESIAAGFSTILGTINAGGTLPFVLE